MLKKILVVGDNFVVPPKFYGGSNRVCHHLCMSLSERGYEVNLIAKKNSKTYSGRTISYVGYRYGTSWIGRLLSRVEFQAKCASFAFDCDLVHSFRVWPEYHHLLNQLNVPIIYRQDNTCKPDDYLRIKRINPKRGFLQCISRSQASSLENTKNYQPYIIYNPVDTNMLRPILNPSGNYLAYLGRLNYDKGVDLAVQLSLDSKVPLKIAGPVQPAEREAFQLYESKIKPFLGNNIEHIGEITDQEKSEFLGNAMALLVPNRWDEPFGLVMAEALACGTPIIGTRTGSIPEIIEHGKTGYICDSYHLMLEAIFSISSISRKVCRDQAVARFGTDRFADEVVSMYREVKSAVSSQ